MAELKEIKVVVNGQEIKLGSIYCDSGGDDNDTTSKTKVVKPVLDDQGQFGEQEVTKEVDISNSAHLSHSHDKILEKHESGSTVQCPRVTQQLLKIKEEFENNLRNHFVPKEDSQQTKDIARAMQFGAVDHEFTPYWIK